MLNRVINCFYNQTYENKQLVIVYEESDTPTCDFIRKQKFADNVKTILIESSLGKIPLGELRNISIRNADGEYVCQWDDDDWFDPDRLTVQMQLLGDTDKPACILSRWIVFDSQHNKSYISNKRLWEGSVLCRKEIMLDNPYPALTKGEDSSVIEYLHKNDQLHIIENRPELYIYISHGTNTWEQEHFDQIFQYSKELPPEYSIQIQELLAYE